MLQRLLDFRMSLDTKKQNAFFVTWAIENFSYCVQQKGKYLESPEFTDGWNEGNKFSWLLYPKGVEDNSGISFALRKCDAIHKDYDDDADDVVDVHFSISVIDTDGLTNLGTLERAFRFTKGISLSDRYDFVKKSDIDNKKLLIVSKDILTLKCVFKKSMEERIVCTRFAVEKRSSVWCIENFSSLKKKDTRSFPIPVPFDKAPCLSLDLLVRGESASDASVTINLNKHSKYGERFRYHCGSKIPIKSGYSDIQDCAVIVRCSISILNTRGYYKQLVECEHLFTIKEQDESFTLPFLLKRSDLLSEKDLLLENDELKLFVNLNISDGLIIPTANEVKTKYHPQRKFTHFSSSEQVRETIFKDVKFCDMTFRIKNEEIHAHKVVICSQSPVFNKMFDCDMTEKTNSVVEITDVDLDIMKLLVRYLYIGKLDDGVDPMTAANLYSAAHKYQVLSLVERCSSLMCYGITFENVWEVLPFAAKYEDKVLMKTAKDFVSNHPGECLNTERFQRLLQIDSR